MKTKTLLNISALKKVIKNDDLCYYKAQEKVFVWDSKGFFAFMLPPPVYEEEIRKNLPVFERAELPGVIKNVFTDDTSAYNILTKTPLFIELPNHKKPTPLFKCVQKNYIIPMNDDFITMINYPESFTIYQAKALAPVHFVSDAITAIIMPIRNNGIKEKIQEIAGGDLK